MTAITNEAPTSMTCCVCKKVIMITDSFETELGEDGGRCYHLRCKGKLNEKRKENK